MMKVTATIQGDSGVLVPTQVGNAGFMPAFFC